MFLLDIILVYRYLYIKHFWFYSKHGLEYHDIPYAEKLHTEELTPLTTHSPTTVKTSSGIFKITKTSDTKREM